MIPRATYRLQLHSGFTFAQAEAVVPYLHALGISHVYASPVTVAQPGSTHGYDVIDPTRVDPELGGESGLAKLAATLRDRGMGLISTSCPTT
jgi:(1->4)-alpha-D-glucan 1-alpha-D-glucosylmutase